MQVSNVFSELELELPFMQQAQFVLFSPSYSLTPLSWHSGGYPNLQMTVKRRAEETIAGKQWDKKAHYNHRRIESYPNYFPLAFHPTWLSWLNLHNSEAFCQVVITILSVRYDYRISCNIAKDIWAELSDCTQFHWCLKWFLGLLALSRQGYDYEDNFSPYNQTFSITVIYILNIEWLTAL